MGRDRSPEAMARAVCDQHWPVGTKRLVYREEVTKVMAYLIRRIRERDARLCLKSMDEGFDSAVYCAEMIRAQNRKPT